MSAIVNGILKVVAKQYQASVASRCAAMGKWTILDFFVEDAIVVFDCRTRLVDGVEWGRTEVVCVDVWMWSLTSARPVSFSQA